MNLVKSAATVGGLTAVSRVLGFVRDILIAFALGTGPVADAFFVAFRFPNLFRRLFAEGAFNAAFVPLFSRALEGDGEAAAKRFAEEALSALFWTVLVVSIGAELAMPWLMYVIAPGFADTPDKFDLSVLLTRIAFPYLAFMSLVALISGALNSLGRFAAAAAAPILLNVVLISVLAAIVWLGHAASPRAGVMLAWGVAAAGLLQLVMVYAALARAAMALAPVRPRLTAKVRRLLALSLPVLVAGGITQVNILVGTIIASFQDAAVSFLYYADRIYQLPLGIVGIAIGVVLLPDLSRRLRAGDDAGADASQNRAFELSMLLTLPAAAALIVIPGPIIGVLFERGAFDAADTAATAAALAAFAVGLPAFVLIKVFQPGFFAREDTATPMWFAGAGLVVNAAGSLVLIQFIGHVGIAIATSLAGWVNAGLLGLTLARRGALRIDERLRRRLPRIVAASLAMAAGVWLLAEPATPYLEVARPLLLRAGVLVGLVAAGCLLFWACAELLGAASLGEMRKLARGRGEG